MREGMYSLIEIQALRRRWQDRPKTPPLCPKYKAGDKLCQACRKRLYCPDCGDEGFIHVRHKRSGEYRTMICKCTFPAVEAAERRAAARLLKHGDNEERKWARNILDAIKEGRWRGIWRYIYQEAIRIKGTQELQPRCHLARYWAEQVDLYGREAVEASIAEADRKWEELEQKRRELGLAAQEHLAEVAAEVSELLSQMEEEDLEV